MSCDGLRLLLPSLHRVGLHYVARAAHQPNRLDYPSVIVGTSAHVSVMVATALGAAGQVLAKQCLSTAEADWQKVQDWFGSAVALPRATMVIAPLSPTNNGQGGAYHYSCADSVLYCDADFARPDRTRALFVAELSEVGQSMAGLNWNCGASPGEGLSRVHAEVAYPGALDDYETASVWLDGDRADWIDSSNPTDQAPDSNGCSVLFLFWLQSLGITVGAISQAPGGTLAATYQKLSGKPTAWLDFSAAVNALWPAGKASGVTTDNPWPSAPPHPPPPTGLVAKLQALDAKGNVLGTWPVG